MRKARKIRQELGASMNLLESIWKKPKGMHWRTFDRLHQKALQAEEVSWMEAAAQLSRIEARLPDFT